LQQDHRYNLDMSLNLSGTLNIFRLLANPALCLPHATVPTFNDLPIPVSKAFAQHGEPDIKAVVLDKDNCFAIPKQNEVYGTYKVGVVMNALSTHTLVHTGNIFLPRPGSSS